MSEQRDLAATRQFFTRALQHGPRPTEVSTDRAPTYPRVLEELLPAACHIVGDDVSSACLRLDMLANRNVSWS